MYQQVSVAAPKHYDSACVWALCMYVCIQNECSYEEIRFVMQKNAKGFSLYFGVNIHAPVQEMELNGPSSCCKYLRERHSSVYMETRQCINMRGGEGRAHKPNEICT